MHKRNGFCFFISIQTPVAPLSRKITIVVGVNTSIIIYYKRQVAQKRDKKVNLDQRRARGRIRVIRVSHPC